MMENAGNCFLYVANDGNDGAGGVGVKVEDLYVRLKPGSSLLYSAGAGAAGNDG